MSSRCKACDCILLEGEIIWHEDEQRHEELCTTCLKLIHKMEEEEADLTTIIEVHKHTIDGGEDS